VEGKLENTDGVQAKMLLSSTRINDVRPIRCFVLLVCMLAAHVSSFHQASLGYSSLTANRARAAGAQLRQPPRVLSAQNRRQTPGRLQTIRMSSSVVDVDAVDADAVEVGVADSVFTCPVCTSPIDISSSSCTNCGTAITSLESGAIDLLKKAEEEKKETSSSSSCSLLNSLSNNNPLANNPFFTAGLGSLGFELPGQPLRQELFRTPTVARAYERGWRASFAQAGFPGIEKEFDLVMDYFQDKRGLTVLDLSCGSGLMVRRLAKSNAYGKVIALDFSESMLEEVQRRKVEENCPPFDVVRGDVQALPFRDESLDAIHSGAALHCWPSVEAGLDEVHRVLQPGGRFFATTFLWGVPDELVNLSKNLGINPVSRAYRFFSVPELERLMGDAGFAEVEVEKRSRCAIIRCRKAPTPSQE